MNEFSKKADYMKQPGFIFGPVVVRMLFAS